MNPVYAYLLGAALTACLGVLVAKYLRNPLKNILIDLCGTNDRAEFWLTFTNINVLLVPIWVGMYFRPSATSLAGFIFDLSDQLQAAILGLIFTVVVLGIVLNCTIRKAQPAHPAKHELAARQ